MCKKNITLFNVKTLCSLTVSTLFFISILNLFPVYADSKKEINISQQDLGAALLELAKQRNINIIYKPTMLKGLTSPKIVGHYSTRKILQTLLQGSGYTFKKDQKGHFYIRKKPGLQVIKKANIHKQKLSRPQADDISAGKDVIEDIVTTGSHIPGVGAVGAPVFIFDRQDIDQKGYSTIPQFIQNVPQNFNGGISEITSQIALSNGSTKNQNDGTGVNLRGLGNISSLVLLNGQRIAPSGSNGGYVDISMLPLSMVDRVEVLLDGASAIYGSDAIGGVVNFKLREGYNGAETRLRYGLAPEGGLEEVTFGQTLGKSWQRGHALLSYEYNHRDPLDSKDRSFTENAPGLNDLLPEQERHSLFLTGGYDLTEDLKIFTTAYYNGRDSKRNQFLTLTSPADINNMHSKQYGVSVGGSYDLDSSIANGWRAEVVSSFSRNEYMVQYSDQSDPETVTGVSNRFSDNLSLNMKLDGALFSMPGGDAKLAIGGHVRHASFGNMENPSLSSPIDTSNRDVMAIYGELYLPFVGGSNRRAGIEKLEMSASVRYEHYNDFGSTTNPKVGLQWSPVRGFRFRGTLGTSFRAPLLNELDETRNAALLFNNISNPTSETGTSLVVVVNGTGNSSLQPEKATLWTVGVDIAPTIMPNLKFSATYFNINYKNRIDHFGLNVFTLLTDPASRTFADFDGTESALFGLVEKYDQSNFTFFPLFGPLAIFDDADVVLDGRITNLFREKVKGIDFASSYSLDTDYMGNLHFSLHGTYLFNFVKQANVVVPGVDVLGTINNPVSLQMFGGVSWTYKGLSTNLIIKYVDSYEDNRIATAPVPVSSWTTMNLSLSYDTEEGGNGWSNNSIFTLSVRNLFNQNPPYISPFRLNTNIFYDPNIASPEGRVVSFQITKKW